MRVPALPEVRFHVLHRRTFDHRVRIVEPFVRGIASAAGALVVGQVLGRVPATQGQVHAADERHPAVGVLHDHRFLMVRADGATLGVEDRLAADDAVG